MSESRPSSPHDSWSSISDTVSDRKKVTFEEGELGGLDGDERTSSQAGEEEEEEAISRCHIFIENPGECVEMMDDDGVVGNEYFIRVMLFDSANADQPRSVVIRNDEVDGQRQTPSTGCLDFSESAAIELVKGHDSKESSERIIGRTMIGIEDLSEIQLCSSTNLLVRELYDPTSLRKVGTIDLHFVIVTQMSEYYRDSLSGPLKSDRTGCDVTIIGHRGIGSDEQGSRIRENTLLAFNQAAKYGANAVEFDVFLTSDKQPMVYHDLQITATYGQSVTLPITALSREGLTTMDESSRSRKERRQQQHSRAARGSLGSENHPKTSRRATAFVTYNRCESSLGLLRGGSSNELDKRPGVANMHDGLPTLRCVLEGTPSTLGALVEIKFMFSSFDPELCVTLRQKQSRFPVIFNVWFGYENEHDNTEVDFTDVRNVNPYAAIEFCVATRLTGICGEASWIMKNDEWARECKQRGLSLYTYGEENSTVEGVDTQIRRLGVDGCIVDNINRFKSIKDSSEVEEKVLLTLAKARKKWAVTKRQSMAYFPVMHDEN
ncbi:glycerophosphoryl diester phosphodiesterase, putative [Perkinsus marinus ATCC 50983]|uniref:Glycerophosphoryl diester phosphodiesterase, putative n=1 Tax=Perkinsus marinus (strain ATCC 50983 / TXsc) TaxID=423536 RepID=C5KG18_PERM5|nr:glycerophosphoryl diester phosphodiesterase, putative [Perkinsus marinus ATCC 50983]EER16582.1 glycerophosphoryl diester phosphodiesterase, putative [Perkinsus marinus ATCC 50983]|eukprot:XP_002784786.1 glycerophosphoryl diester phosphodiesterase, putative [Perkinsus marinus ATCC 50983]